ncbi:TIGR00282 family metallophosphoesterase [Brytella acorum]|uniref:TIGR00282 family metallophosphoesterase n=1 Tax=Brytella acorum TaxID=2959299 RepID=A0AA35XYT5_9PROT|nr:TIGR00282 family metallophosphoesterase [Brytella acorum]MDF3625760.1 TIGR00282 family metallophosphoesterase [Brytella acorum]CAI9121648.1 TIGR00282 family metallophosphoesterase [Brytella acorum]
MRLAFLGDVLGRAGRDAITQHLPALRTSLRLDVVVANGENASHGYGLSPSNADDLFRAGVDVITLGNHAWDRRDMIAHIGQTPRIIRPLNYPQGTPGQGYHLLSLADGRRALVVNVMGRLFMDALDDPFRVTAELLTRYKLGASVQAVIIDIHGEATSEKMAFGHVFDGHASLVVGTHTHVPTADARILSNGTAYQTDAGMCGDYDSVIGMGKTASISRFLKKMPGERPQPAEGEGTMCGVFVETDDKTGLAKSVQPIRVGGLLAQALPA